VRFVRHVELPPEMEAVNRRAKRIEWITIAYFTSLIILLYFVLGSSQAMKAAWVEDILALFPPISFLVASRFRERRPNSRFPWGYHRAITVAYVVAAVALVMLGLFIFVDSADKLIRGTHPTIGLVEIFDWQVWHGWVMIAVLLYGLVPSLILGRRKQPLAEKLHDKVLYADARMNRADWMTAGAAILGIVGIGLGLWWADAVAALVISLDILHDGQRFVRESVSDLMDESPQTVDESEPNPVIGRVRDELGETGWVADAALRLREHGHRITGEVWVVPTDDADVPRCVDELCDRLHDLDWRLHEIAVVTVEELEDAPEDLRVAGPI
jgi:cation diffusion facilitator family transporter